MAITTHRSNSPPSGARALARHVLDLLDAELAAIEAGDPQALGLLLEARERAVGQLHAAVFQPVALATSRDPAFLALMEQITAANAANGQHVGARLAYTRARLGGLTHAVRTARSDTGPASMYQPDGSSGGLHRASGGVFGRA